MENNTEQSRGEYSNPEEFDSSLRQRLHPCRIMNQVCCDGEILKVVFLPEEDANHTVGDNIFEVLDGWKVLRILPPAFNIGQVVRANTDSPLHYACGSGNIRLLNILLDRGACILEKDKIYKRCNSLRAASNFRKLEVVKVLLARRCHHSSYTSSELFIDAMNYSSVVRAAFKNGRLDVAMNLVDYLPSHRTTTIEDLNLALAAALVEHACGSYRFDQYDNHYSLKGNTHHDVVRILLQNGADCHARTIISEPGLNKQNFPNMDTGIISGVLLDYGAGSISPCRLNDNCECGTNELRCFYEYCRARARQPLVNYYIDSFERFFVKAETAGLKKRYGLSHQGAANPPTDVDWSESRREAFRKECEAELKRMKTDSVNNTSATYFDLLSRNLGVLRDQPVLTNVNLDACVRNYPIYGDMTNCSIIRLPKLLFRDSLLIKTRGFFYLTEYHLLKECAELVKNYLSDQDLQNVLQICQGVQRAQNYD